MDRPDIERIQGRNVIEFSDVEALIDYIEALEVENAQLRATLFNLLDMCDVQAHVDGVLSVLREAMEEAREALAESEDAP